MEQHQHNIKEEFLVKYILGEASLEERKEVESWVAASDDHKKQMEQFVYLWEQSKLALEAKGTDENLAWLRFKEKVANTPKKPRVLWALPSNNWLKIAAAMLLLLLGTWVLKITIFNKEQAQQLLVETKNNIIADTLPDGSVVTLNKNSSISYSSQFTAGNNRLVQLKGEAFFKVTPNTKQPFLISVNNIQVKVVGTSFNIKEHNGTTEVIVKTGVVEVIKNNQKITLYPMEKGISNANAELIKDKNKDQFYDAYQSHELVCEETPLWRLVEVLNLTYNSTIVIGNPALANLKITTTFVNDSLDKVLQIIATTLQFEIEKKGNKIILQ